MPKPEWGAKRSCLSCGARFYDLMRDPILCPKCGARYDTSAVARPKRIKPDSGSAARARVIDEDIELLEDDRDVDAAEEEEDEEEEALPDDEPALVDDDETDVVATPETPAVEDDDAELADFDDDLLEDEEDETSLEDLEDVAPEDEEPT